jgi:hypothetical protein
MIDPDADRLELLDRLAERLPELDLDQHEIEWRTLEDGHEALLVDGGGSMAARAPSSPMRARTCTRSACSHRLSRVTSAAS